MSQLKNQLLPKQTNQQIEVASQQQMDTTKFQLIKLQQQLKQQKNVIKENKNVFVGTGFTFDLTQYFAFQKKNQIESGEPLGSIFYQISGGGISWIILLYSVFNASFITVWILSSSVNKFLALTWRFVFQSILMIPFVLHEKRTIKVEKLYQYKLLYIFNSKNLKKMYLCSFSGVLWYGIILTVGQWTYLSHALYLGSLINFFLSLNRIRSKNVHEYQIGGQLIVVLGIIFLFIDTIYFRYNQISPSQQTSKNNYYLHHSKTQRFIADIIAIFASFILSKFSKITTGIYHIFPPFLSMLIIDMMNVINMGAVAYFFNGVTFDSAQGWGFFSMFRNYQFAFFLYSGIVLSIGLVISFVIVAKLFPNFVAPSIAYFCEPGLTTLILNITGIQALPRSFSLIGYTFMTPGMALILLGQWLFLRNKKRQKALNSMKYTQLKHIKSETTSNRKFSNQNLPFQ